MGVLGGERAAAAQRGAERGDRVGQLLPLLIQPRVLQALLRRHALTVTGIVVYNVGLFTTFIFYNISFWLKFEKHQTANSSKKKKKKTTATKK